MLAPPADMKAMPATTASRLLTVDEVASLLRLHHRTVRKLIANGELRAVYIGRAVRIREDEVERFLDEREL
jgi:excisionase family DNA binding protein